jgi:RNA polymerase sigma-70 factor, ECF subfamily
MDQPPNDEMITVLQAQQRCTKAFERLMSLYERPLLYYIRRQVRDINRAQDISQETWLAVWKALPRLKNSRSFRPWLYQIARQRVMLDYRQSTRREFEMCEEIISDVTSDTEADIDSDLQVCDLRRAIDRLAASRREVIILHYVSEFSVEEISAVLGCPVGTVKSRLYHARQELKQVIIEENKHDKG